MPRPKGSPPEPPRARVVALSALTPAQRQFVMALLNAERNARAAHNGDMIESAASPSPSSSSPFDAGESRTPPSLSQLGARGSDAGLEMGTVGVGNTAAGQLRPRALP